jgi:hypothetical protein
MVKKELVDYILKGKSSGYDVLYLRDFLLKQGYSQKDVDDAIDSAFNPKEKTKINIPGKFMIIALIALVVIVSGIFAIITIVQKPATVEQTETTIPAEEQGTETTQTTQTTQVQSNANVEVRYEQQGQTLGQVAGRLQIMSEADALRTCRTFSGTEKDSCFNRVALERGKSSICAEIVNVKKKDNCYMNFAYLDDYTVCTNIQDIYLKQSCRELGRISLNSTAAG